MSIKVTKEARIVDGSPIWWYKLYINDVLVSEFN